MNDMENMRVFADQLWKYMVPKLDSKFASNVSYFRAVVVSNPGNNKLEVQRPVENGTLTLPCVDSVAHAQPGQQVVALVMGSMSNAIVVGDGKLNPPLSTFGPDSTVTLEAGDGGMPFRKLVSDIVAVQTGSGDPSPDNVRPINGFTEMNLHLNESVFNVSFGSAGTVYGGTLDLLTGVLTVTHWAVSIATAASTGYGTTAGGVPYLDIILPSSKPAVSNGTSICSMYSQIPKGQSGTSEKFKCYSNSITVYDSRFTSKSNAETALTSAGFIVVYPLATTVTYQLTPQRISSLPGQNTIWSDTGDVTVEYGQFLQALQQEIENMQ